MTPSIFTRERRDTIALVQRDRRERAICAWLGIILPTALVASLVHASMVAWPFPPRPEPLVIVDGREMSMGSFCDDVIRAHLANGEPITGDVADACL